MRRVRAPSWTTIWAVGRGNGAPARATADSTVDGGAASDGTNPTVDRLRAAEAAENFPVALRILPATHRRRLKAVYAVVRTIDDLGDEGPGGPAERIAALEAFRADLHHPTPEHPVLRGLAEICPDLSAEPFDRLLDANVQDQETVTYATWEQLLGYCALSADPIGRMVLGVFRVPADAELLRMSDAVCSALQVLEHCQDVAEDRGRGRIYLPAADRGRFGVAESDLDAPAASPELRALVGFERERAEALLAEGAPIVGRLRGWPRLAVAGYVAGGLAAAAALRRVDGDVLGRVDEATDSRKRDVLRYLFPLLLSRSPARTLARPPKTRRSSR